MHRCVMDQPQMMARQRWKGNAMTRNRFSELSGAASRTRCPYCEHRGLEFILRCDLGFGPCLFTARCGQCNTSLEVVVSESELDPVEVAESAGCCPECGDPRRVASLECSEMTHACVYQVECRACGQKSSA